MSDLTKEAIENSQTMSASERQILGCISSAVGSRPSGSSRLAVASGRPWSNTWLLLASSSRPWQFEMDLVMLGILILGLVKANHPLQRLVSVRNDQLWTGWHRI